MVVRKCRLVAASLLQSSTYLQSLDRIHWKKTLQTISSVADETRHAIYKRSKVGEKRK